MYGIELHQAADPALVVSDLPPDTGTLIPLDPNTFGVGTRDAWRRTPATNQAVLAASGRRRSAATHRSMRW